MSNPNPSPENRFKPGQSGNPGGRVKAGLKDHDKAKFRDMTEEQKNEFLEKMSPELRYRMAEGNPAQTTEAKVEITLPAPLLEVTRDVSSNNSNQEALKAQEED